MSLPVDLTTIEVTGEFLDTSGGNGTGAVLFTPTSTLVDATGKAVLTQTAIPATVSSGVMATTTLVCTDNTTIFPQTAGGAWAYTIVIAVPGAAQTFDAYIPSSYGSSVDITQLIPAQTPPSLTGPYVQSVNGQSGTVVLNGTILASGTVSLTGGTATVSSTAIPLTGIPYALAKTVHGSQGILSAAITVAGAMTITSSNGSDTSLVSWAVFA